MGSAANTVSVMITGRRLNVKRRVRPFARSARITVYLRSNRRFTVWYLGNELFSELLFGPIVRKLKDLLCWGCGTVTQPEWCTNPENISWRMSGEISGGRETFWQAAAGNAVKKCVPACGRPA